MHRTKSTDFVDMEPKIIRNWVGNTAGLVVMGRTFTHLNCNISRGERFNKYLGFLAVLSNQTLFGQYLD
jgi:hypothetical protein